jgi:hypothetical protein
MWCSAFIIEPSSFGLCHRGLRHRGLRHRPSSACGLPGHTLSRSAATSRRRLATFMIAGSIGAYTAKTARDHGVRDQLVEE